MIVIYYNNAINVANDTLAIADSVWRLLIATNLNTGTLTNPAGGLSIGNEPNSSPTGGNAYPWIGDILMVLIYNRILSSYEIIQNFNAVRGRVNI